MYRVKETFEYLVDDSDDFCSVHDALEMDSNMPCPCWDGSKIPIGGEKTIYIDFYPGVGYYENIWNKRQITNIIGVGRGINYDVVNTQDGKTKYLCSIGTSLVFGRPDICFYFKK